MERRDHIKSGCYIMEIQILHWFETLHNPITNPIFYVITTLGNAGWFWIVLAVLMLTVLPKKYKKAGLTMAIALILSLIFCNGIMKHLWARPRAFWVVGVEKALIALGEAGYQTASPYYPYRYAMWQYTSTGSINGVSGNVDINIAMKNLKK